MTCIVLIGAKAAQLLHAHRPAWEVHAATEAALQGSGMRLLWTASAGVEPRTSARLPDRQLTYK